MQKLTELENFVSALSETEYAEFRQWFWLQENERWDTKLEKDIAAKKLDDLANLAVNEFRKGNYKPL